MKYSMRITFFDYDWTRKGDKNLENCITMSHPRSSKVTALTHVILFISICVCVCGVHTEMAGTCKNRTYISGFESAYCIIICGPRYDMPICISKSESVKKEMAKQN
jgi:hypothetical protein